MENIFSKEALDVKLKIVNAISQHKNMAIFIATSEITIDLLCSLRQKFLLCEDGIHEKETAETIKIEEAEKALTEARKMVLNLISQDK